MSVKPFAVRKVEEFFVAVDNGLVESQSGLFQYFEQFFGAFRDEAVGGFAFGVLRMGDSAGKQVDRFAAVAARDGYCAAISVAKRLEQADCKVFKRIKRLWRRNVFKTVFDSDPAVCEFF